MQQTSRFLPAPLSILVMLCFFVSVTRAGSPGLYLVTDKEKYTDGEQVRFQAFILYPAPTTNNSLFVGLLDCKGREVSRKILPAGSGSAWGSFELPEKSEGDFYLYCYITDNRNQVQSYLTRKIAVTENGVATTGATSPGNSLTLSLACEGNTFVAECPNNILIRCTDGNGDPAAAAGLLLDDKGAQLSRFETNAGGYVRMLFSPEENGRYHIVATGKNGATTRQDLPAVASSGVSMKIALTDTSVRYTVFSYSDSAALPEYIFSAISRTDTVYASAISFTGGLSVIKEDISFNKLPKGFLTFSVTDKKGNVAAKRIFYNWKETSKNSFIRVMDTVARREALVTLPAYVNGDACLTIAPGQPAAAVKGPQPTEAYSFIDNTGNNDAAFNDYLIACQLAPVYYTAVRDSINRFLALDGIMHYADNKIVKNKAVTLVITQKDQGKSFLSTATDKTGRLKLNNLVFFDSATVYYQLADKSDENNNYVSLDLAITPARQDIPREWLPKDAGCIPVPVGGKETAGNSSVQNGNNINSSGLPGEKTLQGVTVTAEKPKQKTLTEQYLEKRGPGQFDRQTFLRSQFNFLENPQLIDNTNLLDFIRGRMGGFTVTYYKGRPIIMGSSGLAASIFLDDIELDSTDLDLISQLSIREIAMVKYYSLGVKPGYNGGGSLMIYTLRGFSTPETAVRGMPKTVITGYASEKRLPASGNNGYSLYWQPGYDPEREPVIYMRLPDNYQQGIRLTLEGVNNQMAPYRFTQELVFR